MVVGLLVVVVAVAVAVVRMRVRMVKEGKMLLLVWCTVVSRREFAGISRFAVIQF
jgi:hypothetical protein